MPTVGIVEAAEALRVSRSAALRMCREGRLRARKSAAGAWRVRLISTEHMITPRALAEYTGWTTRYIRRLCKERVLRAHKAGEQWRIPLSEATQLMLSRFDKGRQR